jgi:hypothetical protein
MQNGTLPHIHHDVNYLNNEYGNLNPLDFYFWGHICTLVYNTFPQNRHDLWPRILVAPNQIRNDPELLTSVKGSFVRRLQACIENNGGHFEHLFDKNFIFCSC